MPLTSSERFALLTDYSKFGRNIFMNTHILLIAKKVTNKIWVIQYHKKITSSAVCLFSSSYDLFICYFCSFLFFLYVVLLCMCYVIV